MTTPTTGIPPDASSPFPFAAAADIIRAHQKDAYFSGVLTAQLSDLHRRLLGVRSAHAWSSESRTLADLLYLSLTTLLGNRTLGEEYCDLVQVSASSPTHPLPTLARRASYIASAILLPYSLSRLLPRLRTRLRTHLESRLASLTTSHRTSTREYTLTRYLLTHLAALTSGTHLHAATLAVFYFSGAYYTLSKRFLSLRYVFTRRVDAATSADRAGYEVLGVLLLVQLGVQAYLHVRETLSPVPSSGEVAVEAAVRERVLGAGAVSLDHEHSYAGNNELLLSMPGGGMGVSKGAMATATHTPALRGPRYDLRNGGVMGWIRGQQQRKCTLCLEELKDPAATQCGHVFCWECIGDWIREKPECPLCRREAMVQHVLPLRVA